jgi:pimeloyl-ACP methyl ester carboxylesterase
MSTTAHVRRLPRPRIVPALAAATGLLVGTLTLVSPGQDRAAEAAPGVAPHVPELDWQPCEPEQEPTGPECATALVPLDHDRPDGALISIAVERVRATGTPEDRIGTLFFNPGGPGGSATESTEYYADELDAEVRQAFDVVGFDPRGVGGTSPTPECDTPDGPALPEGTSLDAWTDYMDAAARANAPAQASCTVANAHWFAHAGTVAVARDLDLLRAAVGDDQLTYHGISYGSRLGSVYAQLFPHRVRAMVLDGNMDPFGDVPSFFLRAKGFEAAFRTFRAWNPTAGQQYDEVQAVLAGGPFIVEGGDIDSRSFRNIVSRSLGSEQAWPRLAAEIRIIHHAVVEGGDVPVEPTPDEVPDPAFIVGEIDEGRLDGPLMHRDSPIFWAVMCQDNPARPSAGQLAQAAIAEIAAAPTFGFQSGALAPTCASSPVPQRPIPRPTTPADTVPLLVVQSRNDPQTPFPWGESMLGSLASGSRMVVYEGASHGMYSFGGSSCVDAVGDAYLVHGTLPATNVSCEFVPPELP